MKIIVCIKQIRHTYARTGRDPDHYFLTENDHLPMINPYDEAAFKLALRFKEKTQHAEIILLTLGALSAERQLRHLMALGADRLIRIEPDDQSIERSPRSKASILAKVIKRIGGDVVFCGRESLDRKNGQVGARLADQLGLPFVASISSITMINQTLKAEVERKVENGIKEIWKCSLPAVFSVDLNRDALSIPALKDRVHARQLPIEVFHVDDQNNVESDKQPKLLSPYPRTKIKKPPQSHLDSFERIRLLLSGSQVQKEGEIVKGSMDLQVQKIISFLKERNFL